jgi:hypothetical protein
MSHSHCFVVGCDDVNCQMPTANIPNEHWPDPPSAMRSASANVCTSDTHTDCIVQFREWDPISHTFYEDDITVAEAGKMRGSPFECTSSKFVVLRVTGYQWCVIQSSMDILTICYLPWVSTCFILYVVVWWEVMNCITDNSEYLTVSTKCDTGNIFNTMK